MSPPRLQEVVIDCADPASLAAFWGAVFHLAPVVRGADWAWVEGPAIGLRIAFQAVPEPKRVKNRVHLDVEVDDLPAETARLVSLGARAVGGIVTDDQGSFQVLTDPEGNELCLVH